MEASELQEILVQAIERPQLPGVSSDDVVDIPRKELINFLTERHTSLDRKHTLTNGVFGLVVAWLSTFEREGRPTMLGAEDFAVVRFNDKIFSLIKEKLVKFSLFRSYVDVLSIVCCKLALLDLCFCTKSTHSARQYLNGVYKATIGLNEEELSYAQPILLKIDDAIKTVLIHYQESPDVFLIALAELKTFISEYENRVALVEKRLRDTEVGRYNSQRARIYVVENVNKYLVNAALPESIEQFIKGDWLASLQLALLKEGSKSTTWKKMLKITETLIWCFGERSQNDMQSMYNFLTILMNGIRHSLYAISHDDEKVAQSVSALEGQLIRILKGETLERKRCDPISIQMPESITGMGAISIDSLQFVDSLAAGDWLILKQDDDRVQFGKLAVIISGKDSYIFVNRYGARLKQLTKLELANAHVDKKIYSVEKEMVFDGAIAESVQHYRKIQLAKIAEMPVLEDEYSIDAEVAVVEEGGVPLSSGDLFKKSARRLGKKLGTKENNTVSNKITPIVKKRRLEETSTEKMSFARMDARQRARDRYEIADAVMEELPKIIVDSEVEIEAREDLSGIDAIGGQAGFDLDTIAPHIKEVDNLNVGAWLVCDLKEGREIKCKLAVKMKTTRRMIFVDRSGGKVLDVNRQELAEMFAKKTAIVLENGKVFDAALEQVVKSIRKEKDGKQI